MTLTSNQRSATAMRYNKKCGHCGAAHSVLASQTVRFVKAEPGWVRHGAMLNIHWFVFEAADGSLLLGDGNIARTCSCGAQLWLKPVRGIFRADKKCDARCTHATGHSCECSCGGKNHGAAA